MSARASRLSGGLIALAGGVLVSVFFADATTSTAPRYWLLQLYPIALSVTLLAVGILLARGRLIADRFIRRLLAWVVVGVIVFSLFVAWFYGLAVMFIGYTPLDPPIGVITILSLGALAGLLIGTYDARAIERKQAVRELSKVNETLRIATGELVEQTDRDALERAICGRLVESDAFDAAWIGRYASEDGCVRPTAWAGFDDVPVESLTIPVDSSRTDGSVWGRAVGTEDGRSVRDVPVEKTTGRWRRVFERHSIASIAVIPVVGADGVYGLVCICSGQGSAFDEHQQEAFTELGETVGHAIDSIRAHDALEVREQELLEQNDRLDEFAGVVSHDLRSPLNVILGRVAMMKKDDELEHLDEIEQSGRRMEEIVTDLLALSRASRAAVHLESVPLASTAAKSWKSVETDRAEFDLQIPEMTTIRADPARLRTVFENLFRNAIEHNDPPLTVRAGVIDTESLVGFFIEDDGDGILADEREEIFDHGYTTNPDGTGFGLSIVREIVEAHDWDISIREGRDEGARFELTGVEFDS